MELPVGEFITEALGEEVPLTARALLESNVKDEIKHDLALGYITNALGVDDKAEAEALRLRAAWEQHPDHTLCKALVAERAIFFVFLRMLKKFKPNDAEVQVLDEDDQQMLAGTRSLGSGLTPELLNDLIQEKPDNVSTALRKYLETGSSS